MRIRVWTLGMAAALALSACGGGGGDGGEPPIEQPLSCSVADQNTWLRSYMNDWYFWYGASPRPDPAGYASVQSYFDALLYQGTLAGFPKDRWSYMESTAEHQQFYGEGKTLGYGLFVAGLEVAGHPEQPLRVRYLEPQSPAAYAGLRRGDQILSVNGRPASELVAANDFTVLTPHAAGEQITLQLRTPGGDRTAILSAAVYSLVPVFNASVVDDGSGRRTGYLVLKDFIGQAEPALESAFATFKAAQVDDLVIDLRYNGGGLVSTANTLASYVGGPPVEGQVFSTLLYNDKQQLRNQSFRFASLASALGVGRVYVLAGQRTCSASELVINGLRPYMDVVLIGDTTCGKPVGFLPISQCGTTYNVVNFESVNARNEGRYFDGLAPGIYSRADGLHHAGCAVADDLDHALGAPDEALLATARYHAVYGACPAGTSTAKALGAKARSERPVRNTEPGEHTGLVLK